MSSEGLLSSAFRLHRAGDLFGAGSLYRRALAIRPDDLDAIHHLGLIVFQQGGAAVPHLRRALGLDPVRAAVHGNLALAESSIGNFPAAARHFALSLIIEPASAATWHNKGLAEAGRGDARSAAVCQDHAIRIAPDYAEAHNALGVLAIEAHDWSVAKERFQRTLAIAPAMTRALGNYGRYWHAQGNWRQALLQHQRALWLRPDMAESHNDRASAQAELGEIADAKRGRRQALALSPCLPEALANLGVALQTDGRLEDAVRLYRRSLAIRPDFPNPHADLASALQNLGLINDAIERSKLAIAIAPEFDASYNNLSVALVQIGHLNEAEAAIERAIKKSPSRADFYRQWTLVRRVRLDDPFLFALQALVDVEDRYRIDLHFALGKAYEDIGRRDAAFEHYLVGNSLKREQIDYDAAADLMILRQIQGVFSPVLLKKAIREKEETRRPVFILGMPRSGTSLVEQILASHPRVTGGGELEFLPRLSAMQGIAYPDGIAKLSMRELDDLGRLYLDRLPPARPGELHYTDKLPCNFRFVGLIRMILPEAKIIHVRRDPVDTCLSCFSRLFVGNQPFTYDLGELGRYYHAYAELMAYWRQVLPDGVMLDVQYEEVVGDLSGQARRLIDFCGLEWDEACLSFHQTERVVRTASAVQVRQPIYRNSIGKWCPDRSILASLLDGLAGDVK